MFIKRKKIETELHSINQKVSFLKNETSVQKILQANILRRLNNANTTAILADIKLAEYKVYSQWGDDGIIQFLADYLDIKHKTFIEFGVEDYSEANTRFLLENNNWTGLIMDGSESNIKKVREQDLYWKYNFTAINRFITAENINQFIEENGFVHKTGLLHIDIDGNDYWVWKAITNINPEIVIIEYNSVFGKDNPWTVPYKPDFYRTDAHYSNLYFGSSLLSLCDLAEEKGYAFIGCNNNGNNAYFIRKNSKKGFRQLTAEQGYIKSQFRESRDQKGVLNFITDGDRLAEIKGTQVFNTRLQKIEVI